MPSRLMRENDERPAVPAAGPLRSARAGRRSTMPVPLEVSDICLQPAVQQAGSADRLIAERAFPLALRFMARGFLTAHEAAPRTAALFATQQRWLLCHAGLAQYFLAARCGGAGLTRRGLGLLARQHGIASRNTAYAFFRRGAEIRSCSPGGHGRRGRPVRPDPVDPDAVVWPASSCLRSYRWPMPERALPGRTRAAVDASCATRRHDPGFGH